MTSKDEGQDEEGIDELQRRLLFERQKQDEDESLRPSLKMASSSNRGDRSWLKKPTFQTWSSLLIIVFIVSTYFNVNATFVKDFYSAFSYWIGQFDRVCQYRSGDVMAQFLWTQH